METDYNGMDAFDRPKNTTKPNQQQQQQRFMSFKSLFLNAESQNAVIHSGRWARVRAHRKAHTHGGERRNRSTGISNILENINFTKNQFKCTK